MSHGPPVKHPSRATTWHLKTRTLTFGRRPLVMGIVNVTPDSFSDGGRYSTVDQAVEHALQLLADGADLLDVGGESTRPYSLPISVDEELRRTTPVFERLAVRTSAPLSIDTSKALVAQACLDLGAEIINDVTALTGDPAMLDVAVSSQAGVCAMHMQGTPADMQDDPHYEDVVGEVAVYLEAACRRLTSAGVDRERIAVDPGVGFGKTHQHNLDLLAHCGRFHALGRPLLVGHSRKGFIAKVLDDKTCERDSGTVGAALALARHGVQILRVHDAASVRRALLLFEACGGLGD